MDSLFLLSSMPPIGDIMNLLFILFVLLAFPVGIGYVLWHLLWDSSAIFRGIVKFIWKVLLFPISLPFSYFQRIYKEKLFEKKALKFVPKANEALELLKTFFLPNKIREAILGFQKRFERFLSIYSRNLDLSPLECLKKLSWKNDSKGENLAIVTHFMQMKEFQYKFKNGKIEFIHN